jgi:glycosyltransferase involved in cell wall biosynthesis
MMFTHLRLLIFDNKNFVEFYRKKKLCFIINRPVIGGAEGSLLRILEKINHNFECHLIFLNGDGPLFHKFEEHCFKVYSLDLKKNLFSPLFQLIRLVKLINQISPNVLHSWLYISDLFGGLAAILSKSNPKVIWSIRHSNCSFSQNKFHTFILIRICGLLTHIIPDHIISCSYVAAINHTRDCFYKKSIITIIPNGYDTTNLVFCAKDRSKTRFKLNIPVNSCSLIGFIGRYDIQKGVDTFISICTKLKQKKEHILFVFVGPGCIYENIELRNMLVDADILSSSILLGPVTDIKSIYSALDLVVLPSRGEAFPNVLAEVMSFGIPVVATNVGDIPFIVKDVAECFNVKDIDGMVKKSIELLELDQTQRDILSLILRHRITENYSIESVSSKFKNIYNGI